MVNSIDFYTYMYLKITVLKKLSCSSQNPAIIFNPVSCTQWDRLFADLKFVLWTATRRSAKIQTVSMVTWLTLKLWVSTPTPSFCFIQTHPNTPWSRKVWQETWRLKSSLCRPALLEVNKFTPLGTRRCYDVESTSMTLMQRRNNVVCPVGQLEMTFSYEKLTPPKFRPTYLIKSRWVASIHWSLKYFSWHTHFSERWPCCAFVWAYNVCAASLF